MSKKLKENQRRKNSYKKKPSKPVRKMKDEFQKELDAPVPKISFIKENDIDEGVKDWAKKEKEECIYVGSKEFEPPPLEKPINREEAKSLKRKPDSWGIIVGETD